VRHFEKYLLLFLDLRKQKGGCNFSTKGECAAHLGCGDLYEEKKKGVRSSKKGGGRPWVKEKKL